MRKGKLWLFAGILFAALAVTGCGNTESADKDGSSGGEESKKESEVTIRVGVSSGDQNYILKIVDEHTGLFSDNGINYEITEFSAGINTIDAIVQGQLDIGNFADYAGVNRIGSTVNDTDLRAFVNTNVTKDGAALYVNPEKIREPEDFYDKTLLSQAGVVYEYDWGKLFEKYGLDADRMNLVNVDSVQGALALAASGDGDAWWANQQSYSMFEDYGWKRYCYVEDVDASRYIFLVSTEGYLTDHHDDVVRFLKTSEEGLDYISDNLEEVAGWVNEKSGLDEELFISGWESSSYDYGFSQEAYDDLKKVEKWCYENGNFDTDYEVGDFINTDAIAELHPDRVYKEG